jgi:hypothetical protein
MTYHFVTLDRVGHIYQGKYSEKREEMKENKIRSLKLN